MATGDGAQVGPHGLFDLPDLFVAQVGDPTASELPPVEAYVDLADLEERAAIMQFDGGLTRGEAERLAGLFDDA